MYLERAEKCSICDVHFGVTDSRTQMPHLLDCGHTICRLCVIGIIRAELLLLLRCPLCRGETNLRFYVNTVGIKENTKMKEEIRQMYKDEKDLNGSVDYGDAPENVAPLATHEVPLSLRRLPFFHPNPNLQGPESIDEDIPTPAQRMYRNNAMEDVLAYMRRETNDQYPEITALMHTMLSVRGYAPGSPLVNELVERIQELQRERHAAAERFSTMQAKMKQDAKEQRERKKIIRKKRQRARMARKNRKNREKSSDSSNKDDDDDDMNAEESNEVRSNGSDDDDHPEPERSNVQHRVSAGSN